MSICRTRPLCTLYSSVYLSVWRNVIHQNPDQTHLNELRFIQHISVNCISLPVYYDQEQRLGIRIIT